MHPQRSPWPESLQLPRRSRRVVHQRRARGPDGGRESPVGVHTDPRGALEPRPRDRSDHGEADPARPRDRPGSRAGRCCTNPHWPARCQPTGFSPADAIRHWSAEGGHPIEDFAAEDYLTPLPGWAPGAKAISDDGFVSEERILRPAGHSGRASRQRSLPRTPTPSHGVVARIVPGPHEAHRQDPHRPMRYDTGRPRAVIRFKISQPRTTSLPCPAGLRARRPAPMMDL